MLFEKQNAYTNPPHPLMTSVTHCSPKGLHDLTTAEWKVLLFLADDVTTAEIAAGLCLTSKSVENYRTRIGRKLEIQGHHKLAQFARKYAGELRQQHEELLRALPPPLKIK
jgi:DNA-binding NarL/FixJ family response regulator